MKSILLLTFCLLASGIGRAAVDAPASSQSPKRSEIKPGTLITRKTVFGFSISNAVLLVEERRALIRVSQPESIRYEWLDLRDVLADRTTFTVVPPVYNPYESVLVPIPSADKKRAAGYEQHSVIHMIADDLGRETLMTSSGLLVGIGTHSIESSKAHGENRDIMHPNIPVEAGESAADAIHRHNETYGDIDGFEYLNPEVRVFRIKSNFPIARARALADKEVARMKMCAAFR